MAKPAKKDLPVGKDITGGKKKDGGKLAGNDNMTLVRAAKSAKKDLPAPKDVKGGAPKGPRISLNDSLTLVRGTL
jgi:hypothetical protein